MATSPSSATDRFLVHRTARAHPRPAAAGELLVAAPPAVASTGPAATAWLQYLVPLLGGAGSFAFLLAVPGPRHPWLVVAVVGTAVASLALGLALRLAERRAARRARRRERSRYLAHLARTEAAAGDLAAAQRAAADHQHPDPPRLLALTGRAERLWERRPADDDFLTVRVGRGPVPLAAPLRLAAAAGPLVEHDPELLAAAEALVRRAGWLPDAPVAVPLRRLGVVAVSGPRDRVRALARAMVCQLAVLHAPDDLRILGGFPPAALPAWEWLKWLPHARDPAPGVDGPPACLLAATPGQLAALLDREVRRRPAAGPADGASQPPPAGGPRRPHLVAVVEVDQGDRRASGVPPLEELLDRAVEAGAGVVWLTDEPAGEPSELAARLLLDEHGSATFEETAPGGRRIGAIRADALGPALCETVARRLAPLRLDRRPGVVEPGPVRLLDLLGAAGAPGGPAGWRQQADRSGLLRVPVGVRPGGEPVLLDLKEAAEGGVGPHGLVVGATGSGKSELLRTIVAGLAATHPPELLAFVLVDFKGGAAFASLAALPQVAGLITNLQADLSTVDRARAALQGEQERRQRLLREAGNQPDLRAYAARRAVDPTLPALPHLLVVVDEFGELLDARPDFLDLFVAVGRVGRSLGMHLLLASQRLDEGRLRGLDGHLRYRVCLRTFSAAESSAVLGTADAYHLPPAPGAALLKVDAAAPRRFTAALVSTGHRSARAGPSPPRVVPFAPTRQATAPAPAPHPGPADSVAPAPAPQPGRAHGLRSAPAPGAGAADRAGMPAPPGPSPAGPPDPPPGRTDLELLVAGLEGAGRRVHQVWLPPLGTAVPLDGLPAAGTAGWLRAPVGLVDRPLEQAQEPLVLDFSGAAGHLAVVGAPRTGKSTLLCTVVAALAAAHRPDEVQLYGIDLGGGLLHRLAGLPHVGAVCGAREPDRARRLARELRALVAERERRFRDLGLDSMAAWHDLRRAGLDLGPYGEVFLLVDNWGALARELPELEAAFGELAASGLHYGVHLVLAANRWADLRPGLRDNLGGRLELRLNDPLESELGRSAAAALPAVPGRGLVHGGLQFQAALPGPPAAIRARALAAPGGAAAPPLRLLPELLGEGALPAPAPGAEPPEGIPFAVEEHRLEPAWLDLFRGPPHFLILGDAECGKTGLLRLLARGLAARHPPDEVALLVVDQRRGLLDLAGLPHLAGYAADAGTVAELAGHLYERLCGRLAGRDHHRAGDAAGHRPPADHQRLVLFVDDHDLLPSVTAGLLAPLADLLAHGAELGFHLVLARAVAGFARSAFEPVLQRLRELGAPGLVMSGDPQEGPLLGGHKAEPLPAGRGLLVRRRRPATLVQVALCQPPDRAGRRPAGAAAPTDGLPPLAVGR
jgi:DNA segregation ATPase FtsK/SpoIIIE, S-DNA-T family